MTADITVIFGPDGATGDQIRSVLGRLAGLSLTNECHVFWIDASQEAWSLAGAAWRPVESLQDEFALIRCHTAFYIAVELSRRATPADGQMSSIAIESITESLRLPPGIAPVLTRLVVPLDRDDLFSSERLPGWATVVASPENQFSDRHAPGKLKLSADAGAGNYYGHVASHIASTAELWRTDELFAAEQPPTRPDDTAVTQRVFVRSVVGVDISDQIIDPLLGQRVGQWPVPSDKGTRPLVAHPSPPDLIQAARSMLQKDNAFRYARPTPFSRSPRIHISLHEALNVFARRLRGMAVDLPYVMSSQVRSTIAASAARITTQLTGLGADDSSVRFDADRLIAGEVGSPAMMLDRIGESIFVKETPRTWRELRSTCFGLLDGDPNTIVDEIATIDGRRTVILDPHLVASPPSGDEPTSVEVEEPTDDGAEEVTTERDPGAPGFVEDVDMTGSHEEPDLSPDDAQQSLLARVRLDLDRQRHGAAADVAEARQVLVRSTEDSSFTKTAQADFARLRRWGKRAFGVAALATLIVAYITVRQIRSEGVFSLIGFVPATGLLIALVVGVVLGLAAYAREELRIQYRRDDAFRHLEWAQQTLPAALSELHRLSAVREQLVDWSTIISTVIHRPWGSSHATLKDEPAPSFTDHELPLSVFVVFGSTGEGNDSSLRAGLESALTRTGWIGRTYQEVSEELLVLHARDNHRTFDHRLDPDFDVPTAANGTRTWLAAQFEDAGGLAAAACRRRAKHDAVDYLLNLDPVETLPELDPVWNPATLLDGLSTSELLRELASASTTPFYNALFTALGQHSGRQVEQSMVSLPPPLRGDATRVVADTNSTEMTLVTVRVDLSGSTPKTHYAIFGSNADAASFDSDEPSREPEAKEAPQRASSAAVLDSPI